MNIQWILGKKSGRLRALRDEVVILRDMEANKTAGGIHIPDAATKDSLPTGKVIAVGPGKLRHCKKCGKRVPLEVKVGDHVGFRWEKVREIPVQEGKRVLVCKEDDIAVVLED
jgi:chaperonin GroES